MKTKSFQHLASFGFAGAKVPTEKLESLFSMQVQTEALDEVLRERDAEGPSLHELREPDMRKVNYDERVRSHIHGIWQPLVEDPLETAATQLLERLNHAWHAAEKRIGDDAQRDARNIFLKKAADKAGVIREQTSRIASEKGIQCAITWLQRLKEECVKESKRLGQAVVSMVARKDKQKGGIEGLKTEWNEFLSRSTGMSGEPQHVARNFLLLAGIVLLIGFTLWFLSIPINSLFGVAGVVVAALIALKIAWPLFKHLGISREGKLHSARLASAYKATSLCGLDEMTKRLELEYYSESLPSHIDGIITAFQERQAALQRKREALKADIKSLHAGLHTASATVRTIVREEALANWYNRGKSQVSKEAWKNAVCSIQSEPLWAELNEQAMGAFKFMRMISVEEEIFKLYTEKDDRIAFLTSIREAAIGRTPGEALISIDFSSTGARPMENHLIIEVADPDTSALAKEIQSVWGNDSVGLSIVPSSESSAISFVGLIYGFPFEATKDYAASLRDFELAVKEEGNAIFPVLMGGGVE